jgi:carbon starvation protein CstA
MTRYPFYFRLILVAAILAWATLMVFPHRPWHLILLAATVGTFIWGIVLMYLHKTGKSYWNGPNWGAKLQTRPGWRRFLAILPGLCAAMIPILVLMNRRMGLTGGQLGFACGVLLGISIVSFKYRKSGSACCLPEETPTTQQ